MDDLFLLVFRRRFLDRVHFEISSDDPSLSLARNRTNVDRFQMDHSIRMETSRECHLRGTRGNLARTVNRR